MSDLEFHFKTLLQDHGFCRCCVRKSNRELDIWYEKDLPEGGWVVVNEPRADESLKVTRYAKDGSLVCVGVTDDSCTQSEETLLGLLRDVGAVPPALVYEAGSWSRDHDPDDKVDARILSYVLVKNHPNIRCVVVAAQISMFTSEIDYKDEHGGVPDEAVVAEARRVGLAHIVRHLGVQNWEGRT